MLKTVTLLISLAGWFCFTTFALGQQLGDAAADADVPPPMNSQPADDTAEQPPSETAEAEPSKLTDTLSLVDQFFGTGGTSGVSSGDAAVDDAKVERDEDSDPKNRLFEPPSLFGETPRSEKSNKDAQRKRSAARGEPIELVDGYQPARQLALLHQRPLLVVFGADWCAWCRKLEQDLTSPEADPIRRQWVVAKVDVDDQPQLARQMDVSSLPAIRVINTAGDVLASRTGYAESGQLQAWLDEHLEQADPNIQRVLLASGVPSKTEIGELVAMLQRRSPSVRASASRRLREHRSVAAAAVVDQFRAAALSSQLTALEILEAWDAPVAGLDPWLPDTINDQSLEPLLQWVRGVPRNRQSDQDAADGPSMDAQSAAAILRQLIAAAPVRRQELAQQAISGGPAVAVQARLLLDSLDNLSDDQRQLLRQVRYEILAGSATRIESAGLLESLARLDGPTRREAAEKLMHSLTSQDQPLVDELSRDPDPLVRELAVSAQSRIGALTQGDRLQRLLSDDSPSVRTAVLRQLAEDPQDEVTASLVEYLNTEPDEDLLVYATKTLGQLAANKIASQALADLMGDSRWRVRAAALDASRQFFEDRDSVMSLFLGSSRNVSSSIADGVLAALDDQDPFVVSQAAMTLPYILSRDTAEKIASYMLQDDANFSVVYESIEEHQRELRLAPLVDLALKWLDGDDPHQTADAARLIMQIAPTKMRYRLAVLLKSPHRAARIAALQALIPCLVEFRDDQVSYERAHSGSVAGFAAKGQLEAIPLLRPVPDSFLPRAKDAKPNVAGEPKTDSSEPESDRPDKQADNSNAEKTSVDLVDDFFGSAPAVTPGDEAESIANDVITEVEIIDRELSPDVATELEQPESLFGWALGLLGGRSTVRPPAPHRQPRDASVDTDALNKLDRQRIGLGSYWIERWHSQDDSIKRPTWIRQCQSLVSELAQSQDAAERLWAQTASLALGNTDHLMTVLQQLGSDRPPENAPQMADLISWLPTAERLQWLQRREVNWNGPPDETWRPLRAATQLDHAEAAQWIYDQIAAHPIDDDQSLAEVNELIIHAMLGRQAAEQLTIHSADELTVDPKLPLSIPNKPPGPGQLAMAQWSIMQYQQATSEDQKAVLLTALATASRRHAIAEALAILDQSQEDGRLTRVATALALSDLRSLSADRAVVLLSHPLATVAQQALSRLVSIDYERDSPSSHLGIDVIYFETPRNFAFQDLKRPLPLEALARFDGDEPSRHSAFADALRLSAGQDQDSIELLKRLKDWELARPLVAVALAAAGRTDDAAMQVYTSSVETAESYNAGALYRALRPIKDDRISALRRQLLKSHNGHMP